MRKSLWIFFVAAILAICAPYAQADSYTPTFTSFQAVLSLGLGTPTAPGVTFPSPSLTVTFDGLTFDVPALSSSDASGDPYGWGVDSQCAFPAGCSVEFGIVDIANNNLLSLSPSVFTTDLRLSEPAVAGLLTFTPVATPEPNSLSLVLAGLGALAFAASRRRLRFSHHGVI